MNIISFHTLHDANLSITKSGKIKLILELERYFNKRFFTSSWDKNEFRNQWREILDYSFEFTNTKKFDLAITSWVLPTFQNILKELVDAQEWRKADHHIAHAAFGFYNSKFKEALILSYDGGGNDGSFNIYEANQRGITLIGWEPLNMGTAYRLLARCMPEIKKIWPQPRNGHLSLAGKLMGYNAYGKIQEDWISPLKDYYLRFQTPLQALYTLGEKINLNLADDNLNSMNARDLARTSQFVFEEIVISYLKKYIKEYNTDNLVITGGCALNILANTRIKEEMGLTTYVPPAPNDASISIGAIWANYPPPEYQETSFMGIPAIDDVGSEFLEGLNPHKAISLDHLARLIAEGYIIGIVRGRSEVGPRALGNRSIVCYPDKANLKEKINKEVKLREWYRPLAPVVLEEATEFFFGKKIESPYMSYCYKMKSDLKGKFPAIEHIDSTVRLQTVNSKNNPWFFNLLNEVQKIKGYPILLNTSFNSKGKPLLTHYSTAISLVKETPIDYILLEDNLFSKESLKN